MYNSEPHRRELDGLLGMCEMECAVEMMLQKSERTGVPFQMLCISVSEMTPPSNYTPNEILVGFCQLCARGLLQPGYPNHYFRPSLMLIERMRTRPQWANLPDPPPFHVWYEKRAESFRVE